MNSKYKTMFAHSTPQGLLRSVARVVCVVAMAYYMGKAITSGVNTLGAIIYSLFPVFAFGGTLLLLETQKGNFAFSFSLPSPLDVKAFKKALAAAVIGLIAGVLLLHSGMNSPVDLIMILLVILSAALSVVLMLRGQAVQALCVFILAWPFIIFENGHGRFFFYLTNIFTEISTFDTPDIAMLTYICLLLACWLIGLAINPKRLAPASWSSGIWLFVVAGLLSTLLSPQPLSSLVQFINVILLPVLLFIFFSNEVRSWSDFRKLSLVLGFTMAIITFVWLYYALYASPDPSLAISEFASTRGGGGKILGSRYAGYNGIYYEYLSPLILPSVLALSVTANNLRAKTLWILTAILMLGATFLTFGRNGWIATLLCLQPWIWRYRRGRLLGVLSLACCFVLIYHFNEIFNELFSRFAVFLSWRNINELIHFRIWKASVDMFLKHPWHGIGIGMFKEFTAGYNLFVWVEDESSRVIPLEVINAHAAFFQIISELGILGLIAWGAMLWIPLRNVFSRSKMNSLSSYRESPWSIALQSYSLVLTFFFFSGPLSWLGVESPQIIIFFLWLAVVSNKDVFWKNFHMNKGLVKDQSSRIGSIT